MATENNGDEICRLCFSPKCIKLECLDSCEINVKIQKYLFLSVILKPNDICVNCYNSLESFHDFYERIHAAQKTLENVLHENSEVDNNLTENVINTVKKLVEEPTIDNQVPVIIPCPETSSHVLPLKDETVSNIFQAINLINEDTSERSTEEDSMGQQQVINNCIEEDSIEQDLKLETNSSKNYKVKKKNMNLAKNSNYVSHEIEKKMVEFYNLRCEKCKIEFTSFNVLNKHYLNVHSMKGYIKCCKRNIRVHDKSYLRSHMFKHLHPDMCRCHICGKELSSIVTLKHHMILHKPTEERPFQCAQCDKKFCCRSDLKNHERNIHKAMNQHDDYICDVCGKVFQKVANLRYHMSTVHLQEKKYICEVCARCFTTHSGLRTHMNAAHSRMGPIQCHECKKWLKNPDTLHKHVQLHQQNKFPCPQCDKLCNTASSLRSHMVRHSEARPYTCLVCSKSFKTRTHLKTHAVQHEGGSHHECPYCHKTFVNMSNYYTHRKRMHSGERTPIVPLVPPTAYDYKGVIKTAYDTTTTVLLSTEVKPQYCAY